MGIAKLTTTASCCAGRVYEGLFRLYFRVVPDGWLPITHYIGRWNMNAVGINVSKGKSMIAIMRPFREVVASPYEVRPCLKNKSCTRNQVMRSYEHETI